MQPDLSAQMKGGYEQYDYLGKSVTNAFVPILHVENAKGWHAEMRYNYEEWKAFSFYAGKSYSGGRDFSWTITPLIGVVAGRFKGGSAALNVDGEFKKFFFSAQSQYTVASTKENDNFFYNWSELGYTLSEHFYGGLTVQYTRQSCNLKTEPGLMAGVRFNNLSFPCYLFSPGGALRYVVLGIDYEFGDKK
jgi:hypothetical protein